MNRDLNQFFTPSWAAEMLLQKVLTKYSRADLDEVVEKMLRFL
jgi:hypothetical protein